jgi:hypothetical protein
MLMLLPFAGPSTPVIATVMSTLPTAPHAAHPGLMSAT